MKTMEVMKFSKNYTELQNMAEFCIKRSKELGASDCSVCISEDYGLELVSRLQELESLEIKNNRYMGITIYSGNKRGSASSSDFDQDNLETVIDHAISIAKNTEDDKYSGLAEKELIFKGDPEDLDLFHEFNPDTEHALKISNTIESAGLDLSKEITNSEGSALSTSHSQFVLANTHGLNSGFKSSCHRASVYFVTGSGEHMQRDGWYVGRRNIKDFPDLKEIGVYAARRALSRKGAMSIKTSKAPILFDASIATSLISDFINAAAGSSIYRKASFLLDSLDKQIFSDIVTIKEDPFIMRGMASSYFDNDGVATYKKEIVSKGVLNSYILSSYSARKLGMKTTANAGGVHNLIIESSGQDLLGMLRELGTGMFITELLGMGVNYVTGDYSRGAAGYWVEAGEIIHPVHQVTIAGNLKDMFLGISAIGNDVIKSRSKICGSILINEMTVSGLDQ